MANIINIHRIKEKILAEPDCIDMRDYMYEEKGTCKTVGCICGWANYFHSQDHHIECEPAHRKRACEFLDLPYDINTEFFIIDFWPNSFKMRYIKADTDYKERAQVVADYLDYLAVKYANYDEIVP